MQFVKYILLLTTFATYFVTLSCTKPNPDTPDEDYNALFPFGGIDKPVVSYDEQNIRHCDPQLTKKLFRYPGVEIADHVREYELTLTCTFNEEDTGSGEVTSTFVVKYVGEDKALHLVASHKNTPDADAQMKIGEEYKVVFKAKSGFPMYLSVSGGGDRGASIKATLAAKCSDGYTVVKTLATEQHQNAEGINPIPAPYCNYIILP